MTTTLLDRLPESAGSRVVDLHRFLLDLGELDAPILTPTEEVQVAGLEAQGAFESPEEFFAFLEAKEPSTLDWRRDPVGPLEFISDPYYSGSQAGALFPKLQADFCEIFEEDIHEVILAGSIGWGKTYMMGWGMFYQLYLLSCLANPQPFLGIAPGTPIVMVNLSVTGTQAKNACYLYVQTFVKGSPYFQEHFNPNPKIESALYFPNNIIYQPGSSSEFSAIGANLIAGAVDEANFLVSAKKMAHERLQGKDIDHALVLYRALSRRIESRFKFSRGWKGRLFLASSRVYEGDFIDQQVRAKRGRPGVKILDYAHWEVRDFVAGQETRGRDGGFMYSGDTFQVAVGRAGQASKILAEGDIVASDSEVVDVPIEYRDSFETDLPGSIRDIAGRSTLAVNPWIPNRAAILAQAVEVWQGAPLVHPFSDDTAVGLVCQEGLASSLNLGVLCTEHVTMEGVGRDRHKVTILKPIRDPTSARYMHIDLAVNNDAAGITMGYVAGKTTAKIKRDGKVEVDIEEVPVIVFELLLNLVAPIGGEIEFAHIRELIYLLRDVAGFYISSVTFDQFQSRDSRQILAQKGFEVDEISVDRDVGPYTTLRNGITEGWIYYYPHHTAQRELRKIQRVVSVSKKLKVDHPPLDIDNPRTGKGSKDVTDSMAAVVHKILEVHQGAVEIPVPSEGLMDRVYTHSPEAAKWQDPDNNWILGNILDGGDS